VFAQAANFAIDTHSSDTPSIIPTTSTAIVRSNKNLLLNNKKNEVYFVSKRGGGIRKQITVESAVRFGMLLSLNSGFVNGLCLSGILASDGTKQASAAVTGAWTNSALGFASGNKDQFYFNVKCILSYMFGSVISGAMNPNVVPLEVPPQAGLTFLIGAILLYTSSSIATKGGAKSFLYFATIANGMQNSFTSSLTSNLVRSAHFSGITSDIGTYVGQIARGNIKNVDRLKTFLRLALSFWIGGFLSFYSANEFGGANLLISAGLYLVIGLVLTFSMK